MEEILAKLLVPDSDAIRDAQLKLKEAFQKDSTVPELCNVMATSANPQIRQYGAVLLRKRFTKSKNWTKMSEGKCFGDRDLSLDYISN